MIKNLLPSPKDTVSDFYIEPGQLEVERRDYYIEPRADEQMKLNSFLSNIEQHYDIAEHETASVEIPVLEGSVIYHYCLIQLPDGRKIPYLWQSMAALTPIMKAPVSAASNLIDHWLTYAFPDVWKKGAVLSLPSMRCITTTLSAITKAILT